MVENFVFCNLAVQQIDSWFCDTYDNILFHMNLETGKVRIEAFLQEGERRVPALYTSLAYYKNKLVLAPRNAKDILIYDLLLKTIIRLKVRTDIYCHGEIRDLFMAVRVIGDYAYFFPGRFEAIVRLNLVNYKIEYLDNWYQDLAGVHVKKGKHDFIFYNSHVCSNGVCVMPCWHGSKVLVYNLFTRQYSIHNLKNENIFDAIIVGQDVLASFRDDNGIKKVDHTGGYKDICMDETCGFCQIGENIFGIPFYKGGKIIKIDSKTFEAEVIYDLKKTPIKGRIIPDYTVVDDKFVYFLSLLDGMVYELNVFSDELRKWKPVLMLSEKDRLWKYKKQKMREEVQYENIVNPLKNLLDFAMEEPFNVKNVFSYQKIGKKIYDTLSE